MAAPTYKKLRKLATENRRVFSGLVIIGVLCCLLILKWGYGYHVAIREEIATQRERYVAYAAILERSGEMAGFEKSAERHIGELEKGLLKAGKPSMAVAEMGEAFKKLSSKKGITVNFEKALAFAEEEGYVRIPVEFQFKAEMSRLKELLYDLEASPLLMGIRSVRLKSKGDEKLEVSMVVEGAIRK